MAKLSHRAYLLGFRRAKALMRREVDDAVDRLNAATDEVHAQMRGVQGELARLRTLDTAIDTERAPGAWLN